MQTTLRETGIVSWRVVLAPRSAEIKPSVSYDLFFHIFSSSVTISSGGLATLATLAAVGAAVGRSVGRSVCYFAIAIAILPLVILCERVSSSHKYSRTCQVLFTLLVFTLLRVVQTHPTEHILSLPLLTLYSSYSGGSAKVVSSIYLYLSGLVRLVT